MKVAASTERRSVMVVESTSSPDMVGMVARRRLRIRLTHAAIEIDLRSPSMLHGKKGFERVLWAFTNVLINAVTWLFYDFHDQTEKDKNQSTETIAPSRKPIAAHHPIAKTCAPKITLRERVVQPHFTIRSTEMAAILEAKSTELHEWFGLTVLGSPRIQEDDIVDPYLCRYVVPDDDPVIVSGVATLQWSGLIPASWIRKLVVELR